MAIFIPGMQCSISGKIVRSAGDAVMFPAFVVNEADPIHPFSDAVIRSDVFRAHPLAAKAQARFEEFERKMNARARVCRICGREIADPENYLALGYLVEDAEHELHGYNYSHFHQTCLAGWPSLWMLIEALNRLNQSGSWKGDWLR